MDPQLPSAFPSTNAKLHPSPQVILQSALQIGQVRGGAGAARPGGGCSTWNTSLFPHGALKLANRPAARGCRVRHGAPARHVRNPKKHLRVAKTEGSRPHMRRRRRIQLVEPKQVRHG